MDEERIAKQRLNIMLLVDASKSMQGKRIKQVDQAISDIQVYLKDLQAENSNVDFYITIIPFNNDGFFYGNAQSTNIDDLKYDGIKCGGWSNLHCAYARLGEILHRESKGGIMPDFGGVAPIVLLLTDGHPTGNTYKEELEKLQKLAWFKAALRYGIAIELNDDRTMQVLHEFVGNNGDVISVYDSSMLKNIIKIIVLTASKVKSTTSNVAYKPQQTQNEIAQQEIAEALADTESWEW
ncbi:MAG: VWA domain-containing protein [Bacilli bacterium]|nr:VWA domain-containing protein [Bacilli bacterium]